MCHGHEHVKRDKTMCLVFDPSAKILITQDTARFVKLRVCTMNECDIMTLLSASHSINAVSFPSMLSGNYSFLSQTNLVLQICKIFLLQIYRRF